MSVDPKAGLEVSESLVRSSGATVVGPKQNEMFEASGASPEIQTLVYGDLEKCVTEITAFATKVANFVEICLKERVALRWQQSDDDLFLPHTLLVKSVIEKPMLVQGGLGMLPAQVWIKEIWPQTQEAEKQMQKADPQARIHKGAPLFNVALCFFIVGDFDRAFQYFTQAGIEDELSGRGSRYLVPIGDNPLAERAIIKPLVRTLIPVWKTDFQSISSKALDEAELKSLLAWLVQRAPDAFQTVTALHRLRLLFDGLDNEASRYQMVRALADIVLAVESSLRRWQVGAGGQLFERTNQLLNANVASQASFNVFHDDFNNTWAKPQRESGPAINWVICETFSRLGTLPTVAERIGVAAYLVVRLRNSLMHVNEETLDIHNDPKICFGAAGIVFAVLRISKHGDENTLGGL